MNKRDRPITDISSSPTSHATQNGKAILAVIASMGAYASNDVLMKLTSEALPAGETIFLRSIFSAVIALVLVAALGKLRLPRAAVSWPVFWRAVGEVGATTFFLLALFALPIASVTAILQIIPLALTAASALVLREAVGWRRWTAALIGLIGVSLIVRPGSEMFQPVAILAFIAVGFMVLRDMATAYISRSISIEALTLINAVVIVPLGLVFLPFETWRTPSAAELAATAGAAIFIVLGIYLLILSVRLGEISAAAPFRYSVLLFAILFGWLFWGHLPDLPAMVGIVIIILTGIYTLKRQTRITLPNSAPQSPNSAPPSREPS